MPPRPAEARGPRRKLAARCGQRGVGVRLALGSDFFTHNLAAMRQTGPTPPSWSTEFDDWGQRALDAQDIDALLDFEHTAPAGRLAHPRTEHFAPLFVTLGAAEAELRSQRSVIDGFWMGLAKRSLQFG
ncbi:Dioxygenase OS=Streptomyces antimycoticus OX=68175 GN=SSPO_042800 PE=3 SV=1 [Streptomyces antimycoticus]